MASELIQGIECVYRDLREGEHILYENLPKEEQYFRKIEHIFSDDQLVDIANKEYQYTSVEKAWVEEQEKLMTQGEGRYAYINGKLKYLPASYWGYLNFWTLENGKNPEYREADRKFFLFMEYICFNTKVLGIVRGKGRRKGATSQGTYWLWWICGRLPEKIGGIISFNDDSAAGVYQKMFMRGFKAMTPCFVREYDSGSDKFIRFVKPVEGRKKGVPVKREGLNSYVDYKGTTINAYDSGRLSFFLCDESGKYEKLNINTYWSKVSPTLKEGIHKVGFAYMPTTVNPKNKGGENFRTFWNLANQNAINPNTDKPYGLDTPNKIVQYFDPATEGYAGCIDKYGESVIDDPIEPIIGNDGHWITKGSLSIIEEERKMLISEQLMEHRRDYPLSLWDMFAFETGQCEFNTDNLINQIRYLEDNKDAAYWRQCSLFEKTDDNGKIIVEFMDDPKGLWWLKEEPDKPNHYSFGSMLEPLNTSMYSLGADTYKNIFAVNGSEGAISIFKKSCVVNGVESGLCPVAFFVGRPRLIKQFNRQIFLACLWYGAKVNVEIDAGTWFYEDFMEWNATQFLEWTPAIDPTNPRFKVKPGTESANPFQLAKQLEVAKMYFDGTRQDAYNGNVHRVTYIPLLKQGLEYNHEERTPYHLVVSFMMALLPVLGAPARYKTAHRKPTNFLPTYALKNLN